MTSATRWKSSTTATPWQRSKRHWSRRYAIAFLSTSNRELSAKGNIVDHEYEIERDGHKIAEISKRWFRVRDTYGIEIVPGENDALILAATVCIDEMAGR